MNITRPTHLKIILKKKNPRRTKTINIGLNVTKAFSPTTPPATQIVAGKGQQKQKMLTSIPNNGLTYSETLRQQGKVVKGEKIPDFEPPRLNNLERKL